MLRQWWEGTADVGLRRTGLLAIAMLRCDQPLEFLLSIIKEASGLTARDAIAALGLYRHDDAVWERVQACVAQRQDIDLRAAFAEAFWACRAFPCGSGGTPRIPPTTAAGQRRGDEPPAH